MTIFSISISLSIATSVYIRQFKFNLRIVKRLLRFTYTGMKTKCTMWVWR